MQHSQGRPLWVRTKDARSLYSMISESADRQEGPTVVFEAGSGGTRSSWGLVQPLVGGFARAVAYDRAGLGRSEPDPQGRTLRRMADDLGDVLDELGPGPFILVGHSAGGPIVRLAASTNPGRIVGLVLVEPSDEAAEVLFTPGFRALERVAVAVGGVLARLGVLDRLFRSTLSAMPADVRDDLQAEGFTVQTVRTQARQARSFLRELARWREEPPHVPVPITVISGGVAGDGMNRRMRAAATASHIFRASQSRSGRHVTAFRSAHNIPVTEPEVIVEAVRRMLP